MNSYTQNNTLAHYKLIYIQIQTFNTKFTIITSEIYRFVFANHLAFIVTNLAQRILSIQIDHSTESTEQNSQLEEIYIKETGRKNLHTGGKIYIKVKVRNGSFEKLVKR